MRLLIAALALILILSACSHDAPMNATNVTPNVTAPINVTTNISCDDECTWGGTHCLNGTIMEYCMAGECALWGNQTRCSFPSRCEGNYSISSLGCVEYACKESRINCTHGCTNGSCIIRYSQTCGNGIAELSEECDIEDLAGASCTSLGYLKGNVTCTPECAINASNCIPRLVCGNNLREEKEACDGTVNLTCQAFGFADGTVRCCSDCASIDYSNCSNVLFGCTDSDGIDNYRASIVKYLRNYTYGTNCGGQKGVGSYAGELPDACVGDTLQEAVCQTDNRPGIVNVTCLAGCHNGQCLQGRIDAWKEILLRLRESRLLTLDGGHTVSFFGINPELESATLSVDGEIHTISVNGSVLFGENLFYLHMLDVKDESTATAALTVLPVSAQQTLPIHALQRLEFYTEVHDVTLTSVNISERSGTIIVDGDERKVIEGEMIHAGNLLIYPMSIGLESASVMLASLQTKSLMVDSWGILTTILGESIQLKVIEGSAVSNTVALEVDGTTEILAEGSIVDYSSARVYGQKVNSTALSASVWISPQ